jgi:putative flavoprotein involved in K+ transport
VTRLSRKQDRYVVACRGRTFEADHVVIASGTFQSPIVPEFARLLDPGIRQLHSGEYHNPSQLQPGPVLVVGASHSGADIAYEVAGDHPTVLSGKVHGEIPFRIDSRAAHMVFPLLWFFWNHVATQKTPIGRKIRPEVLAHGGPLIRVKKADLQEAGVERTDSRVTGVKDGMPLLEDGRVLDVTNVIWCTGFGKDVSWIDLPVVGSDGWPEQSGGVSPTAPGLYFVGLPFLYAFASMLIGGVGRDADRVADHISRQARQPLSADLEPSTSLASR